MQINDSVRKYLDSPISGPYSVARPYFLFVGDAHYNAIIDDLRSIGLDVVPISRFCKHDDKLPDIDALLADIKAKDKNADGKRLVVVGLGEFLALRGDREATNKLLELKDAWACLTNCRINVRPALL